MDISTILLIGIPAAAILLALAYNLDKYDYEIQKMQARQWQVEHGIRDLNNNIQYLKNIRDNTKSVSERLVREQIFMKLDAMDAVKEMLCERSRHIR